MAVPLDTLLVSLSAAIERAVAPTGDDLLAGDPDLKRAFETDASPSFPLRAFATFIRRPRGDELAVTVEVQVSGGKVLVESDIFTDAGEMVALGPSLELVLPEDRMMAAAAFDGWLAEFAAFQSGSLAAVRAAARRLK